MKPSNCFSRTIKSAALVGAVFAAPSSHAVVIPNTPLVTQISAKPMVMLVAGKDHKLFYEAYNDTSDIDGDGSLDIGFIPNNPDIIYYGLFDPTLCYTHNNLGDNTGLFTPDSTTSTGKCPGKWSGLWLNYITTARIDSLRKVLYGGYREVDNATDTILRRAYIPADAHSWGKEYTSIAVNGYDIRDYTPFALPTGADKRHFFGSLTSNYSTNCSTLDNCSNLPPLLRVRENVGSNKRIWEWASKERPVLAGDLASGAFPAGTGAEKNYTVRVKVCTSTFHDGCKLYPNGSYKPVGLLHDYGENDAMLFGLLTGSYDQHMSGGRLRKVVSSFKDEVSASTGQFVSGAKIVTTFNNLRIRGFNQSSATGEYWKSNPYTDSAKAPTEGQLVDWGNPIGEMLYEATRYFAGKSSPTAAFNRTYTDPFDSTKTYAFDKIDKQVGLDSVTWDDPYSSSSAAKAPRCARASFLTISDVYPSFDSDQIPGSYFNSTFTGDLSGLNVTAEGDTITAVESNVTGLRFIGQSNGTSDSAPTAKTVTSLGTIRGLAPGEPGKQGSYYSASMAYWAKKTDLRSGLAGQQSIDTFVVALTAPLPQITVSLPPSIPGSGKRTVTLVPFSKSIGGSGLSATKGNYQPTNQIVDFYVESIANSGPKDANASINGGLYYAKFIINYEDVEQGGDHDMDAIAVYEVKANAGGTLSVTVTPTYQAGGMKQNMGYSISGTTKDGVYLVAQDETYAQSYFLNVPSGKAPGYCDVTTPPADCNQLTTIGGTPPTFTFTPSTSPSATLLKDPLWYAAKWGGYKDANNNNKPDLATEWDADGNGTPDNYFLVQNPSKLPQALKKAFDDISKTNSSASNVIANSSSISTTTRVFQGRFDAGYWSGDLVAYPITTAGVSSTSEWGAKDRVPASTDRKLYIRTSAATTKEFLWAELPLADQTAIVNSDTLDYLRGVRTKELQSGGSFRNRSTTVLGDILHSSPFYEKDSDVIYVGANDGMLHAFKGSDGSVASSAGTELFGFIPAQSTSRLKNLTSTSYTHDYYVDGDVVVSPKVTETGSKNYLFAALGRGGKGLFSLDVTNPTSFSASNFLWEYTPTGDTTAATDADLGLMLGRPTYVKMNNGKGAVIVGNGYNSTSTKAVLYIFILNTDGSISSIKKIDTGVAGDNGLATPTAFDADGNGTIDYIYAGDLKGNVWKFDVSSTSTSSWSVAFSGAPLFVAKDGANNLQPITSPLAVGKDTVVGDTHEGKRFVFVGTGSYFRTGDPADTSTQSWYGLIDDGATPIASRSLLKQRTIAATGTLSGKSVRAFSTAVAGDMVGKSGWYLDFTSSTAERIVTEPVLVKLVLPTLLASTIIPDTSDACVPGGSGFVNAISPFSGAALSIGTLDVNNDKNYTNDALSGMLVGSVDLGVGLPSRPTLIGPRLVVGGTGGDASGGGGGGGGGGTKPINDTGVNLGVTPLKGRLSWREIIKD